MHDIDAVALLRDPRVVLRHCCRPHDDLERRRPHVRRVCVAANLPLRIGHEREAASVVGKTSSDERMPIALNALDDPQLVATAQDVRNFALHLIGGEARDKPVRVVIKRVGLFVSDLEPRVLAHKIARAGRTAPSRKEQRRACRRVAHHLRVRGEDGKSRARGAARRVAHDFHRRKREGAARGNVDPLPAQLEREILLRLQRARRRDATKRFAHRVRLKIVHYPPPILGAVQIPMPLDVRPGRRRGGGGDGGGGSAPGVCDERVLTEHLAVWKRGCVFLAAQQCE